jgi:small neutral amino acid transporter SnatA (MarC family)
MSQTELGVNFFIALFASLAAFRMAGGVPLFLLGL